MPVTHGQRQVLSWLRCLKRRRLLLKAQIIMPRTTPFLKLGGGKRLGTFGYALIAILLLSVAIGVRARLIQEALPYCRHVDEHHWTRVAVQILQNDDLNPRRFTKPSAMAYLNTLGLSVGLLRAGAKLEAAHLPRHLNPDGGYPHYNSVSAILTVRQIYLGLSVVAMVLMALCVRQLTRSRGAALVALAFMVLSRFYLRFSWTYLNVDIIGVFFAVCTVSYLILRPKETPGWLVASLAGVLSGLTLGSKYNLFWIVVPSVLTIARSAPKSKFGLSILYGVITALTFVVVTPYAVLTPGAFIQGAASEAYHYASGHRNATAEPGLEMLGRYVHTLTEDLGWGVALVALYGLFVIARRDFLSAAVFSAYPLLLLAYMCTQRVYFARNGLILSLFVPAWASFGLHDLWLRARSLATTRLVAWSPVRRTLLVALGFSVLAFTLPLTKIAKAPFASVESRNEFSRWVVAELPKGTPLVLPTQFPFSPWIIRKDYPVVRYDLTKTNWKALEKAHPGALVVVPKITQKVRTVRVPGKPLRTFGAEPLDLERRGDAGVPMQVMAGNPKFAVYRL